MLVQTRKRGQSLAIRLDGLVEAILDRLANRPDLTAAKVLQELGAESIRVTVCDIRRSSIRIGVDAPKECGIHRGENLVWLNPKPVQSGGAIGSRTDGLDILDGRHEA